MSKVTALIVSAGTGVRMKHTTPKQYLMLGDRPILAHTLLAFNACRDIDKILLVVAESDIQFCENRILPAIEIGKPLEIIAGGNRRQDSVFNGLLTIDDKKTIVVIHDGVRPFVQTDRISECIAGARELGACVLGVPLTDTLKSIDGSNRIIQTVDRKGLWLAQTPQSFQYTLIRKAHDAARREAMGVTDDAALVEQLGVKVKIIEGDRRNIKITTQEDLALAEAILMRMRKDRDERPTSNIEC